jgi:hypothetical protein
MFVCRWHDQEVFWDCLKHKMQPGEFAEADKGYPGEPNCSRAPDHYATVEESKIKGVARNHHETCNKHITQVGCLKQRYRHHISGHILVFGLVSVLTQPGIESGAPLFEVDWPVE